MVQAKKLKSEAEQAGILVWGKISATLAESLTPLLLVRLLGKADVGAFAALMLIYQTVSIVLTAGFPNSVLYFLAGRELGERRQIMRTMTWVMIGGAVLMAGAMSVLAYLGPGWLEAVGGQLAGSPRPEGSKIGEELRWLPLFGLFALADFPARLMPSMLVAEQRASASAGVGVVQSLLRVVGTLVPAALGYGVGGIVVGVTLASVANGLMYGGYLHLLYRGAARIASTVSARQIVLYCIPLGATMISQQLNATVDQWLIVSSFPAELVAIYKTGAYQIPIITTVAYSIGSVYMPRFTTLFRDGKPYEALSIWRGSIRKASLVVVPASLLFIVGAEEFVTVAFTEEYIGSAAVFRAYCFLVLARVAAFGHVILAAGRPGYVLRASLLSLMTNVLLSVPLLATLGFLGPAVGTALNFVPTLFFYNWYIARAAGVPLRKTFPLWDYTKVVLAALIPTSVAVAFKFLVSLHPVLMFGGELIILFAGWALVGSLLGFIRSEDWDYVRKWVKLDVLRG